MKHYVLGFVFNSQLNKVLLIKKERPDWMKGRWNGIGGKLEDGETPSDAMYREANEETGERYVFEHVLTFVCPGGTIYVFAAYMKARIIPYKQIEDEELRVFNANELPYTIMMSNLKWVIPLCLSTVQKPIMLQQNTLGTEDASDRFI